MNDLDLIYNQTKEEDKLYQFLLNDKRGLDKEIKNTEEYLDKLGELLKHPNDNLVFGYATLFHNKNPVIKRVMKIQELSNKVLKTGKLPMFVKQLPKLKKIMKVFNEIETEIEKKFGVSTSSMTNIYGKTFEFYTSTETSVPYKPKAVIELMKSAVNMNAVPEVDPENVELIAAFKKTKKQKKAELAELNIKYSKLSTKIDINREKHVNLQQKARKLESNIKVSDFETKLQDAKKIRKKLKIYNRIENCLLKNKKRITRKQDEIYQSVIQSKKTIFTLNETLNALVEDRKYCEEKYIASDENLSAIKNKIDEVELDYKRRSKSLRNKKWGLISRKDKKRYRKHKIISKESQKIIEQFDRQAQKLHNEKIKTLEEFKNSAKGIFKEKDDWAGIIAKQYNVLTKLSLENDAIQQNQKIKKDIESAYDKVLSEIDEIDIIKTEGLSKIGEIKRSLMMPAEEFLLKH